MDWQVYGLEGSGGNTAMGIEVFFLIALIIVYLSLKKAGTTETKDTGA